MDKINIFEFIVKGIIIGFSFRIGYSCIVWVYKLYLLGFELWIFSLDLVFYGLRIVGISCRKKVKYLNKIKN